jgi:hypothetical protein
LSRCSWIALNQESNVIYSTLCNPIYRDNGFAEDVQIHMT